MEKQMKRLIKWLYFEYVYPDEVERVYELLDAQCIEWCHDTPMNRAVLERKWISDNELN